VFLWFSVIWQVYHFSNVQCALLLLTFFDETNFDNWVRSQQNKDL